MVDGNLTVFPFADDVANGDGDRFLCLVNTYIPHKTVETLAVYPYTHFFPPIEAFKPVDGQDEFALWNVHEFMLK